MNAVYRDVMASAKSAELEAQSRLESIKRQAAKVAKQASSSSLADAAANHVRRLQVVVIEFS